MKLNLWARLLALCLAWSGAGAFSPVPMVGLRLAPQHRWAGAGLRRGACAFPSRCMGVGVSMSSSNGKGEVSGDDDGDDGGTYSGRGQYSSYTADDEQDVSAILWGDSDDEAERERAKRATQEARKKKLDKEAAIVAQLGTGTILRGGTGETRAAQRALRDSGSEADYTTSSGGKGSEKTEYTSEWEVEESSALLDKLIDTSPATTMFVNPDGNIPSHQTVRLDPIDGAPERERFAYVDESTCIGCTHCAMVARNTFFIDPLFGKARVFQQDVDTEELVDEAISTCPVDCIYWVDFEDLVTLEGERSGQSIDMKARLVGASDVRPQERSKAKVMNAGKMRCSSCPARGCAECPLFGVGQNPEYLKKKAARESRRKMAGFGGGGGGGGGGVDDDPVDVL